MDFEKEMPIVEEKTESVHDPIIKIRLSDLTRLQSDAEFYAENYEQYRSIRNKLVKERNTLLDRIKELESRLQFP